MITKNDCLLLLTELQDKGEDVKNLISKLLSTADIPMEVLSFINQHRQLDVANFYQELRHKYNQKKSKLYINLMIEEYDNPEEVITTLAALELQIFLYSKTLDNKALFLSHSRISEILTVLNNYTANYDLIPCLKLLYLIKSDIKVFEAV